MPERRVGGCGDDGRVVRIGGASGAWGDSPRGLGQVVGAGVDYVIMDFLAEVTMSLLARARLKDPAAGYPRDAVSMIADVCGELAARGTRVVTNAGGTNPTACKAAIEAALAEAGVGLTVAAVTGDDVLPELGRLRAAGLREHGSGREVPEDLLTANAYLGAAPITAALAAGADIVVTGRCADSALALGILVHEFGWSMDDHALLGAGSLVGHVLECGPQATGGNFTDWEMVPGWHDIGYPIARCAPDGTFLLTKPAGTGGLVDPRCVAEQILYEVGDPAAYLLPDVTADFSGVRVRRVDAEHVLVSGARGRPPGTHHKVSATYQDGYRCSVTATVVGPAAGRKARRTGRALVDRARMIFAEQGLPDFLDTRIESFGCDSAYGPEAASGSTGREALLRLTLVHRDAAALTRVAKEVGSIGLSCAPGTTGILGGRPRPAPLVKLSTFFVAKSDLAAPRVTLGEAEPFPVPPAPPPAADPPGTPPAAAPAESAPAAAPAASDATAAAREAAGDLVTVPLGRIAHARSGDKGDDCTLAVLARHPRLLPLLRRRLTRERIAAHFAAQVLGPVERYEAPGLDALTFVLRRALGGGGMASLRIDPQGKAFGQMALEMPVEVPAALIADAGPAA